ncbi:MAG: DUF3800 domain-containing protein [Thermodesulfobacteriota bacterium]
MTITWRVTHIAFGDESHWNVGRYRGLGLVTLKGEDLGGLKAELLAILQESGVTEFKWKKLKSARDRFAALKLCEFAVQAACQKRLRVDVLTWDTYNSRHQVKDRDDVANLQRMYYQLFKNVLRERWPDGSVWRLHPDEHGEMDWLSVQNFLEYAEIAIKTMRNLTAPGSFHGLVKLEFKITEIVPVISQEEPLIQLADLFAGLGVFSRDRYYKFKGWKTRKNKQPPIFPEEGESPESSAVEHERFTVLEAMNRLCKQKRLYVSLDTNKGLKTYRPEMPINFWWYEPQHPDDKAPTKKSP